MKKKNNFLNLTILGISMFCMLMPSFDVIAVEDGNVKNQLMEIREETSGYASQDEEAEVVRTYEKGSPVFVEGEAINGWYEVIYQGQSIYVKENVVIQQELNEELEEELLENQKESKAFIEQVEAYRAEALRSKIWAGIIIVLIVGILVTGLIATLHNEKKKEQISENNKNEDSAKCTKEEENEIDIITL